MDDPCAVAIFFTVLFQDRGALVVNRAVLLDVADGHLCIAVDAFLILIALLLDLPGTLHHLAHLGGGVIRLLPPEVKIVHPPDPFLDIYTLKDRS